MEIINVDNPEQVVDALIASVEKQSGSKLFLSKIIGKTPERLHVLLVLENKAIMQAEIFTEMKDGKAITRMQGRYL